MVQMCAFSTSNDQRISTSLLLMLALVFVVGCLPADAWGGPAVPLVDRMRKSPYQSASNPSEGRNRPSILGGLQ
ncbi:hypothetical protein CRM22_008031 [Opisthorchis felineus]|uniref:Secreted protein n=1 Tax=Opisthorchis felineus TaxID=147828 RepID=A0A4S2LD52_OPIFE|nr:hypothetical protein CRM22_008031 [Opisthorchis felineus]